MERETFIENCKNLRKGQRGFVVNTKRRTEDSLMYINIEHESIAAYSLIVYTDTTSDVTILQGNRNFDYFRLRAVDYKTAWDVLEDRLNRLCNPLDV